jgi:hypothetical protein
VLRLKIAELHQGSVIGSGGRLIDYCRANIACGKVKGFAVL